MSKTLDDTGIYYFLGNITSHILHALPLQKELGGTFVVLSDKSRKKIKRRYDVPVINVNNKPRQWVKFSWRVAKPVTNYVKIGRDLKATTDFLNAKAKVVIFYEPFDFASDVRLTKPKTVFLTHGFMLKKYMTLSNRLEIIKQYDYMAAIGPHMKRQFIKDGVEPEKLVDIGIARTDEIVRHTGEILMTKEFIKTLKIDSTKKVISYMPTFWGASSIYSTGLEILRNFPDKYTLFFRPHPQTPSKILAKYFQIMDSKSNIVYVPEGKYKNVGLTDILNASSAIIGDISSVMLEAILIDKPLLFAYGDGEHRQEEYDYVAIKSVVDHSESINSTSAKSLDDVIERALNKGINAALWQKTKDDIFFHNDGTSVKSIARFIKEMSA